MRYVYCSLLTYAEKVATLATQAVCLDGIEFRLFPVELMLPVILATGGFLVVLGLRILRGRFPVPVPAFPEISVFGCTRFLC
jgi:hypothetical protein